MVFILYFEVTLLKVWRHPHPYPHESPSHSVSFLHCLQPNLPSSFKTHTDLFPLEVCFFFSIISSRRWGLEFWILIVQKLWVLSKSHSSLASRRQGLICYQMFVMMNTNSLPACILPFTMLRGNYVPSCFRVLYQNPLSTISGDVKRVNYPGYR